MPNAAELLHVEEERRLHAAAQLRRGRLERGPVAEPRAAGSDGLGERTAAERHDEAVAGRGDEQLVVSVVAADREALIDAGGTQRRHVAAAPRQRLERAHRALRGGRVLRGDHERGAPVGVGCARDVEAGVAHPAEEVAADVEPEALLRLA